MFAQVIQINLIPQRGAEGRQSVASHQLVAIMTSPHVEQRLVEHGIYLITKVSTNMRNRVLSYADKPLLRKRAIPRSASRYLPRDATRNGSETR